MSGSLEELKIALADRYEIQRELGAGGMAAVYLARDLKHDRDVAIKVVYPELGLGAERFLSEIKISAQLNNPHILALLDSGAVNDSPYYVMPHVEGRDVLQFVNEMPASRFLGVLLVG